MMTDADCRRATFVPYGIWPRSCQSGTPSGTDGATEGARASTAGRERAGQGTAALATSPTRGPNQGAAPFITWCFI